MDCSEGGLSIIVTCTLRSLEEQAQLYAVGRTVEEILEGSKELQALGLSLPNDALMTASPSVGRRKTKALPGLSFHNPHVYNGRIGALAADFVPVRNGKAEWENDEAFAEAGQKAELHGLTWSGRWVEFKETCHVQWDEGRKLDIEVLAKGGYG